MIDPNQRNPIDKRVRTSDLLVAYRHNAELFRELHRDDNLKRLYELEAEADARDTRLAALDAENRRLRAYAESLAQGLSAEQGFPPEPYETWIANGQYLTSAFDVDADGAATDTAAGPSGHDDGS